MPSVRRGVAALCLFVFATSIAAETEPLAQMLVRDTTDRVRQELRDDSTLAADTQRLFELVNAVILPHFDFERISRRVLGRYWKGADSEQQTRFKNEFRILLLRTYAIALAEFRDQSIRYLPYRERREGEISVRTEVIPTSGPPIPINYEMYLKDDTEWKVYDLAIDGVSLVMTYRTDFRSQVRQEGIDTLIARLVEHNQIRSGGE